MPLDASIPLAVRPTDISPFQIQGQLMSLKDMANRQQFNQQMQPLQVEAQQQSNDMRRIDLEDQQIGKQAFMEAGGDPDKFMKVASEKGMSPKNLLGLQQHYAQMRNYLANLDQTETETIGKKHALAYNELRSVLALPEGPQRDAEWSNAWDRLYNQKILTPADRVPRKYPCADQAQFIANGMAGWEQLWREDQMRRAGAREERLDANAELERVEKVKGSVGADLANAADKAEFEAKLNAHNAWANQTKTPVPQIPRESDLFDAQGKWKPGAQERMRRWGMNATQLDAAAGRDEQRAETRQRDIEAQKDRDLTRQVAWANFGLRKEEAEKKPDKQAVGDEKAKDEFQRKAQEQWTVNIRANQALQAQDNEQFSDPKSGAIRYMTPIIREELKTSATAARQAAQDYEERARRIRERRGWGEYEEGAAPAAKPAQPAAKDQAAKGTEKKAAGYTEADARAIAKKRGWDKAKEDEYVRQARAKGLIQ